MRRIPERVHNLVTVTMNAGLSARDYNEIGGNLVSGMDPPCSISHRDESEHLYYLHVRAARVGSRFVRISDLFTKLIARAVSALPRETGSRLAVAFVF